ncbi:MAG: TIGR00270 family protein [Candidatus Thermoplasmatota archaeon]|nr:TIGR00270 family protein [Candidatus Thermoplasmatota archaeon]
MLCELCGKDSTFCKKVTIEGVQLEVCAECAKFGIEAKKAAPKEVGPKPVIAQRLEVREKRARPKDVLEATEREELVEDYGARIRDARAQRGVTQKDLAMKINERLTVLSKIETGDMRPDDKIVAKLEKELGIKLKEKVTETQVTRTVGTSSMTLADLIRMQKD